MVHMVKELTFQMKSVILSIPDLDTWLKMRRYSTINTTKQIFVVLILVLLQIL